MAYRYRPGVFFASAATAFIALSASRIGYTQGQEETTGLQEITVSATRAGQTNLQETPIAVTAVPAEELQSFVPRDISEVAVTVPNFSAARITAFNAASFSIRGAGQTDIIVYLEPPVGVLVDDFVMPSVQTQLLDTFDVASVEVLRGPQGTTFGKNTTGGAVVLRTKRPDLMQSSSQVQFGYGSFDRREVKAAFDVPLVEGVFGLRFVGGTTKTDGFYRNGASFGPTVAALPAFTGFSGMGSGERVGGQDVVSGRIKALWQATDNVSAL
jgi:iron complex outermembrane receptor protein